MIRKHWSTLLKITISIAGLAYVLTQVPFALILSEYADALPGWMALAVLLMLFSLFVRAYRWLLLLRGVGAEVRFGRLAALYFVGNFFNTFLPSGFGGDVVRIIEVAQDVSADVATGTVILDRLTGLMMLFLMALVVLPFRPDTFPSSLAVGIAVVCVGGFLAGIVLMQGSWIVRFLTWLRRFNIQFISTLIDRFLNPVLYAMQRCSRRALLAAFAVSLAFNLILCAWWYAAGRSLGYDVSYSYYVLVIPIMSIAMLVPSIGGLGVRELLAPLLFTGANLSPQSAYALSLLVFVLMRLSSLLGAPVYVAVALRRNAAPRQLQTREVGNE